MAKASKRAERKRAKAMKRQGKRIEAQEAKTTEAAKTPVSLDIVPGGKKSAWDMKIPPEVLAQSRRPKDSVRAEQVFRIPVPAPGVLPKNLKDRDNPKLAMDSQASEISIWAASTYASGWFDGPLFMGYPALALLAALPEYRRMAEVLATECTRKWIRLAAADSNDKGKLEKITKIETDLKRMDVRGAMRKEIEQDAFFGIAHLYLDMSCDPDDRDELLTSIGNGRDPTTVAKFAGQTGFFRGVKPVEAVWSYPSRYNATNPLRDDWYTPNTWFVQGLEIHATRLLTFVGRELPDLLKPAYMFGGISLSQLMKLYVDRWIATVQAVTDIIVSFSTSGIMTNLETLLKPSGGGPNVYERAELFGNLRTNRGVMLLDKETEEFFQFNTPLSELEDLMSKMQETLCSISGEPVIKLLGIQPAGLNASSQGEITSWLDWCEAFREKFCAKALTTIIDFVQLSLFGEIDPDITWTWESLRSLDPKEETERRKVQAEQDGLYIEAGVFMPQEIRQGLLADPESPYYGLDEIEADEDMIGGEGEGLVDPDMAAEFPQLEAPVEPNTAAEQRREGGRPSAPDDRRANPASTRRGAETPADPSSPRREPRGARQRTREPEPAE
jgi:uncharacterized protein